MARYYENSLSAQDQVSRSLIYDIGKKLIGAQLEEALTKAMSQIVSKAIAEIFSSPEAASATKYYNPNSHVEPYDWWGIPRSLMEDTIKQGYSPYTPYTMDKGSCNIREELSEALHYAADSLV